MDAIRNAIIVIALSLITFNVTAADRSGGYYVGGGAGSVECPKFVQTMETGRKAGIGTWEYVKETQGYTMFMLGFQTAYNLQTENTCNIFDSFDHDQLLAWTENYCRQNPLDRFASAVIALAKEVHPKRLRVCK